MLFIWAVLRLWFRQLNLAVARQLPRLADVLDTSWALRGVLVRGRDGAESREVAENCPRRSSTTEPEKFIARKRARLENTSVGRGVLPSYEALLPADDAVFSGTMRRLRNLSRMRERSTAAVVEVQRSTRVP